MNIKAPSVNEPPSSSSTDNSTLRERRRRQEYSGQSVVEEALFERLSGPYFPFLEPIPIRLRSTASAVSQRKPTANCNVRDTRYNRIMASRKKVLLKVRWISSARHMSGVVLSEAYIVTGHHPWRQWRRQDEFDESICKSQACLSQGGIQLCVNRR